MRREAMLRSFAATIALAATAVTAWIYLALSEAGVLALGRSTGTLRGPGLREPSRLQAAFWSSGEPLSLGTLLPYPLSTGKQPPTVFLVLTRQPHLFPLELRIELQKWEAVRSHSLMVALSSAHFHRLLSAGLLDMDVGNQHPSTLLSSFWLPTSFSLSTLVFLLGTGNQGPC